MKGCLTLAMSGVLLALGACSGHGGESMPATTHDEKILNIYSWSDYIAPATVGNFEKETGIEVHYDTYDNNEVLETKLFTGHSNYDIVIPSENFFDGQLRAGVYRPLDKQALPNLANADPEIMRRMAVHDPDNLHAIPYMWSTTGLGYNIDMVQARLGPDVTHRWALLFDPRNAQKLRDCGIAVIDSPLDVIESAIIYLGQDPNRHRPEDIAAAAALLQKIRPYISHFEFNLIAPMANGELCLALAWSGDVTAARHRAVEAATHSRIAYFIPQEGAMMTLDMMGIPADAPHPHNAALWMNYLLRPEVTAAISNYIKYPNGNAASLPLIDTALTNDPNVYPDTATRARLVTNAAVPLEYSRLVTRAWQRFRTGQ